VGLNNIDFSAETGKVLRLDLGRNQRNTYSGTALKDFKTTKPFAFMEIPNEPSESVLASAIPGPSA
jgi:hypothetical protein